MDMEQHQTRTQRTRPRVSRACERCRVKKAKCDGEKPCRRCNLDKAPCSYKVRRKTESTSTSQRYTDLLLQHHEALTAGVLELYKRLIHGQQWEGSPVNEVNGSPSVHDVLERLGVLDREDDGNSCSDQLPKSQPGSPPVIKPTPTRIAPKQKNQVRPVPQRRGSQDSECRSLAESPHSATTTSRTLKSHMAAPAPPPAPAPPAPAPVPAQFERKEDVPPTRFPQLPSPRSTASQSESLGTSNFIATNPWDSPDFSDEMFSTPTPTDKSAGDAHHYPQCQIPIPPQTPCAADLHHPNYTADSVFSCMGAENESPTETGTGMGMEMCTTEYFFDATGSGVGMYDTWNGVNGDTTAASGLQPLMQDYSAWDHGVFV